MVRVASLSEFPRALKNVPVFLCVGNFDGVHRGHRALFELAEEQAKQRGGVVGALTFSPHPEAFFRGADAAKLIYSPATKLEIFEKLGLDFAVTQAFSAEFSKIPAEDFLPLLKKSIPALTGVFVGENFRFGASRKGNVAVLRESAVSENVAVNALPPVLFENEKISSTRIRERLRAGEMNAVNVMLAEPYFSAGKIVSGRRLGRTIGFPTLNLPWEPETRPRFGVYAVRLRFKRKTFPAVANYGVRPTVERGEVPAPLLETFLLNNPDSSEIPGYGDTVVVEWLEFLRPEQRFDSVETLRKCLREDCARAEAFWTGAR